jgi:hypothetical protein
MAEGAKRATRWLVIGGLAANGLYQLIEGFRYITTEPQLPWIFRWLFLAPVTVWFSGYSLTLAWFAFTRQYHRLCPPGAFIIAAIAFVVLASIPGWLGLNYWTRTYGSFSPPGIVANIVHLVVLVLAWCAAKRVYRRVLSWLLGYVDAARPK